MQKGGYIYIMTNKYKTTLYIGVTNNLQRRVWEHRTHYNPRSFTTKYNLEYCIYYEYFTDITQAINRETQLKKWNRAKKETLINATNPAWEDLWKDIEKMII
ncbi:MAG: GIY-YIG nuclease family protein [Prevotellaceae bacterium]|jgi:putative endonuclease|nr:GIY-YIG nuclease family protein [Prevotellaceae bacterium]